MRIVFLGNAPSSLPSLEAVARSRHDLALVATRTARPAGRGRQPHPTPVAESARRSGLPFVEVDTVKRGKGFEAIRSARPDVLVVVAYGEIIPPALLEVPRVGPVNLHFSLLPKLRGADPVRRALFDGLETTGVTTMLMDDGLDTGPILLQREAPIHANDDAATLGERLAGLGAGLLVETLEALEARRVDPRPQDDRLATHAPKLRPEDEWIAWDAEAASIVRRVRALAPDPGAKTRVEGRVLKILAASEVEGVGEPGVIVESSSDRLVVGAGRGVVELDRVVPEGRRAMTGVEFARGRRFRPGARLG